MGQLRERAKFVLEGLKVKDKAKHCLLLWRTASEHECRGNPPTVLCCKLLYCWDCSGTLPGGGSLQEPVQISVLQVKFSEMQRKEEAGAAWSFSFYHFKHSSLLVVLWWFHTKQKRVDSSLLVLVSNAFWRAYLQRCQLDVANLSYIGFD